MAKSAAVLGGTGLIGKMLVQKLLDHPDYEKVHLILRKNLDIAHEKLVNHVMPLSEMEQYADFPKVDEAFCCIGTTIKKAGSKAAFVQVDHDFVKVFAEKAKAQGAGLFSVVTAMGADAGSSIFYNRVKGRVEETLRAMEFERIHIFRPSFLLGARHERRLGEEIGKKMFTAFAKVIPAKYRAIESNTVAQVMLNLANSDGYEGHFIFENDAIERMGK